MTSNTWHHPPSNYQISSVQQSRESAHRSLFLFTCRHRFCFLNLMIEPRIGTGWWKFHHCVRYIIVRYTFWDTYCHNNIVRYGKHVGHIAWVSKGQKVATFHSIWYCCLHGTVQNLNLQRTEGAIGFTNSRANSLNGVHLTELCKCLSEFLKHPNWIRLKFPAPNFRCLI